MSSLISGGSTGTRPTSPLSATVIAIASANVIALMMIIRLVKKSITPAATVTKPILVPVVVPIPIVAIVTVPVVLKELPSAVVTVIVVPLAVIIVHATTSTSIHLVILVVLERIAIPLLVLLMVVPVVKVRLDLLRPAPVHLRLAIVLHLPLAILPPLQGQLPVHVGLLPVPATNRRSIPAVRKVLQLLNHVPTIPVIPVKGIALELLLLLGLIRIWTTIRLITGSQRSAIRPSIRNCGR